MGSRWFVVVLVVGAAVGAFWQKRTKDKPYGVALGQDLKGGTTLRFALDVEQARRENRIPDGESNERDRRPDAARDRVPRQQVRRRPS